jgi:hypothetical protein
MPNAQLSLIWRYTLQYKAAMNPTAPRHYLEAEQASALQQNVLPEDAQLPPRQGLPFLHCSRLVLLSRRVDSHEHIHCIFSIAVQASYGFHVDAQATSLRYNQLGHGFNSCASTHKLTPRDLSLLDYSTHTY